MHEGAAQEALRALVVEEPRQAGVEAAGEGPVDEAGQGARSLEVEDVAGQRADLAQMDGPRIRTDAVQRPAAAGPADVAGRRIAGGAGAADAHDAVPGAGQQA